MIDDQIHEMIEFLPLSHALRRARVLEELAAEGDVEPRVEDRPPDSFIPTEFSIEVP